MTETSNRAEAVAPVRFKIPVALWFVAIFAGLLHMAPYWRAQSQTPPGWTFTGTLFNSPDFIQYRYWSRQTQKSGPVVDNKFTTEPNKPHLLVLFYYLIGEISLWTGSSVEAVFAYLGFVLAVAFTALVFFTIRYFIHEPAQAWWVFGLTMIGGGLGAHLKIIDSIPWLHDKGIIYRLLSEPISTARLFEDVRGQYILNVLFDTHFLAVWVFALLSILALYRTLKGFSYLRLALTAGAFTLTTLMHLYEGITLTLITLFICFFCWRKGEAVRTSVLIFVVCSLFVAGSMLFLLILYRSSGLIIPRWSSPIMLFSTVLLAFPLAWGLMVWGMVEYWRRGSLNECFLLGWMAGCIAMVLSGPFYPYPARGTVTMQIPICIVAGAIYFSRHVRVSARHLALAMLLVLPSACWILRNSWTQSTFSPRMPVRFQNSDHRQIIELLKRTAAPNEILLTDKSMNGWESDDLWVYPEYPGKFYCGHFFLTQNFDRKRIQANEFFKTMDSAGRESFLRQNNIRFIFVRPGMDLKPFRKIPNVELLIRNPSGSVFRYNSKPL